MGEPRKWGVSFPILISLLSHSFKLKLASGELKVEDYFQLDNGNAYNRLLYQIRVDVGYRADHSALRVKIRTVMDRIKGIFVD